MIKDNGLTNHISDLGHKIHDDVVEDYIDMDEYVVKVLGDSIRIEPR